MKMTRNDKAHKLTPVEEAIRYFDPYPHPVLRMMAEDYESRQRKKNKFENGTSNRKDPGYDEQEDINGYNYVGKGDMRGLYQVPYSSEYTGYWTADGHPIGINKEGNLVDQITGDMGILNLPEITVTGTEKPHTYATSMSGNLPLGPTIFNPKEVQEPTLGQKAKAVEDVSRGMRVLSPAAWMDTAYDAMYTPEEINFPWMEGNQGLGDPFLDILFDVVAYGGLATGVDAGATKLTNIIKDARELKELRALYKNPESFKYMLPENSTVMDYINAVDELGNPLYPKVYATYQRYLDRRDAAQKALNNLDPRVDRNWFKEHFIDVNPFNTSVRKMSPKTREDLKKYINGANYNTNEKLIKIGAHTGANNTRDKIDNTIVHELGHADQHQYGYGDLDYVFSDPKLESIGINSDVFKKIRHLYENNKEKYEDLGHALGLYIEPEGNANELLSNMTTLKSAAGWSKDRIPTMTDFYRFAYGPGNDQRISWDILDALEYPNLVKDDNKFINYLMRKALVATPAALLKQSKNNKNKTEKDI